VEVPGQLWAEIDLDAIAHNVRQLLAFLAIGRERPPLIMAVVKADGYGHGAVPTARTALAAGASWLGVSTVLEAMELREAGLHAPILVFNPPLPDELALYPAYRLTATTVDPATARRLEGACHVKVDTGFGRFGLSPEEAFSVLDQAPAQGVYTHLAAFHPRLLAQRFARFRRLLDRLQAAGRCPPLAHAASSAALLANPDTHLDLVRVGNLLYGVMPEGGPFPSLGLRQAWRLRARLVAVREVPAGQRLGYAGEHRFRRQAKVAVVPAGFADGLGLEPLGRLGRAPVLIRHLARVALEALGVALPPANGAVELRGKVVRRVGRPGLAHTVVDVTGFADLLPGQEVVLHARRTTVSSRVPRLYREAGRVVEVRGLRGAGARRGVANPVGGGVSACRGEGLGPGCWPS